MNFGFGPTLSLSPFTHYFSGHLGVLCRAHATLLNPDHLDCVVLVITLTPRGQQLVTFCPPAVRVGVNGE